MLSKAEREGIKFTIGRIEAQGYSLDGAIKYNGNQGIDLAFSGTGGNADRFALAEAKLSGSLGSLKVDSLGIRQGSFDFFDTRLQRAGRIDLQQELQSGNVDLRIVVGCSSLIRFYSLETTTLARLPVRQH